MHDIRWIRENPDDFDKALAKRGSSAISAEIIAKDADRRSLQTELQEIQTRRNEASKQIGIAKSKGEGADSLINEVSELKDRMQTLEEREKTVSADLNDLLTGLPNIPADDTPQGESEEDNVEIRKVGQPPSFSFEPKDHVELGENLSGMSFERAGKLSGARFVVLSGALARLERSLAAFMLDVQTREHGYTEVAPPVLVKDDALFGTGQLPKFSEDLFKTTDDLWLIPTAEVPLTNLVADEILSEADLPVRVTALTPCFRSEAGAAGKDTRGMLRQHQFNKVELVSICHPENSVDEHERMTGAAEEILKRLGLAYRVVVLCTGDIGFSARKTYDLEVWLPGQNTYREISSCSNCGAFQARRMKARFRPEGEKGTQFVHTLNGSGLAVGRCLIAVIENYQNEDGSITVPEVLRPYMDGLERISAE
ncbi:MAG: serine--tRNA ligase [Rhodospirillaceae bacterium]|nr:serine--tRNA ligase [Rhodospirillaceae bacterium]|tara:strand:+ start:28693 stop:29967 length:1275 start_codon:yes stop_codon:yes gene_type:complete